MNRVLVLGANSFAARCVIPALLRRDFVIYGVSRSQQAKFPFESPQTLKSKQYKFVQLDLNKNATELQQLILASAPEYVIDFAGQGMVAPSWDFPEQWFQTNVLAKIPIIETVQKVPNFKKYIRFSTPEVYGSTEQPSDESSPTNPSTPYAVSHAAIDQLMLAYFKLSGFPVVLARFGNFYGPKQQLYRIIPKTILAIKSGRQLPLDGGGLSKRTFVFANDIAEGALNLLDRSATGGIYNFPGVEYISIMDLVKRICSLLDYDFEALVLPSPDRKGKDISYLMSGTKAYSELSWKPKVDLESGISETIRWIENNYNYLVRLNTEYVHHE